MPDVAAPAQQLHETIREIRIEQGRALTQNSIPAYAFTLQRKERFIMVISVTRPAASVKQGLVRPVTKA